jgi:hypothetical protein
MLSNFNHERWVMCGSSARGQRSIGQYSPIVFPSVSDRELSGRMFEVSSLFPTSAKTLILPRWSAQRKAFGKPLNSLAIIRSKLAGNWFSVQTSTID